MEAILSPEDELNGRLGRVTMVLFLLGEGAFDVSVCDERLS